MVKTLLVDNYDSFTYNLFQLLSEVNGVDPVVVKNDELRDLDLSQFDNIVISPGPGNPMVPTDIGISARLIHNAQLPTLGVCLGHQAICYLHGATVTSAPVPMHGRSSEITHNNDELFKGIPTTFSGVRYHSLAVTNLPASIEPIAHSDDGVLMAVRHRDLPQWGVQFHPESVASAYGYQLMRNFRDITMRLKSVDELSVRSIRIDQWVDPAAMFVDQFGHSEVAFWLDSALSDGDGARYSYMGDTSGPLAELIIHDETEDVFADLQKRIQHLMTAQSDLPVPFIGGLVGYISYEEDAQFIFADRVIAFDHHERSIYLIGVEDAAHQNEADEWFDQIKGSLGTVMPAPPTVDDENVSAETYLMRHSHSEYLALVARCQVLINAGESYEICLTNMLEFAPLADPLSTYLTLRSQNPAPMASFFRFPEVSILSASPERLVRINRDGWAEAKPIKGTIKRGHSSDEDDRLFNELKSDAKNQAENLMIVDLLRNDLGRVCEIGSVSVPSLYDVETFATVHQLVSTITGKLRADQTNIDCLRSVFPGGSMTGAPKVRTMNIIREFEAGRRGVYSGAIGYLSLNGMMDWSVIIRTIVSTSDRATAGVGGAITALSNAEAEYEETMLKAQALIRAVSTTSQRAPVA